MRVQFASNYSVIQYKPQLTDYQYDRKQKKPASARETGLLTFNNQIPELEVVVQAEGQAVCQVEAEARTSLGTVNIVLGLVVT